eukprot:scaffold264_cov317-Pinguiococcus_pyrenoidosus.AAC.13
MFALFSKHSGFGIPRSLGIVCGDGLGRPCFGGRRRRRRAFYVMWGCVDTAVGPTAPEELEMQSKLLES